MHKNAEPCTKKMTLPCTLPCTWFVQGTRCSIECSSHFKYGKHKVLFRLPSIKTGCALGYENSDWAWKQDELHFT